MNNSCLAFKKKSLVTALALAVPMVTSVSQAKDADMQAQVDALQRQVTALNTEVQQAAEWKNPNTLMHMAGFADVTYVQPQGEEGSFGIGSFSPIFHYQYRDVVMLEAEVELEVGEDGETKTDLGYMTIDWFVSDYMAVIAGKFLSPIGQFRQNMHPSWINKMVSAPPGFGHDGAAPISDTGIQLRGGFPLAGVRTNYSVYVSNGPELASETEDDQDFELDGVAAEGFGADRDGEKSIGGRFAVLPISSLEIGISYATGMATVTEIETNEGTPPLNNPEGSISGETARDYDVTGADFVWFNGNVSLRGEYIKTEIGEATTGITAGEGGVWEAVYTQLAYRLPNTKWEGVIRYGDFDAPGLARDQTQTSLGINYLITNNFIAKLSYEFNDGEVANSTADNDRLLTQLAYGF
ncbi:hypothetical protein MNBD_GAMMA06-897 [hydrothermal vent metagenome]|uniref:Porin n=1 Tax=hydrothermal vent metagenome TaxID=652676 RepID=A0A3B0W7Z7_9ZZZZ